ncbi:MAG: LamG-like jellyroll fold domain-containing protein [Crocinitomicaceae bacterium]
MKRALLTVHLVFLISFCGTAQNALYFDGSNDFVQTNYTGVTGAAARTFEAWVFVSSSAPASNLSILDYGLNAVGSRNTFFVSGTRQLGFISGGTNANISSPASAVPVNQWVHVAFVLNSGTGFLYVDGVQVGTGSLTTVNTPATGTDVRVGQRVPGGSILFNGVIDEVRVWSVARTVSEIQADMNAELCGVQTGLELYLKLNEGAAGATNTGVNTANDSSGNGFTGTLTNFALTGATSNWVNGSGITSLSTAGSTTQTACGMYSLTPTSTVYTTSGIYTETLFGANSAGCDSIVTLDLTINNSTSGTDTQSACDNFTWINGVTYTSSATATDTLTNSVGCDSIVTLNLTINNNTGTDVQSACDSYTWIDGNTYTSDNNTATFTLTNAAGCDSVVSLDLTMGNTSSSTDTQSTCDDSFTWIDGNTYTSNNNTATFVLPNASGCDSTVSLDLTINAVASTVTQSTTGEVLTADQTGATYQWLACPAYIEVTGATSQSYTAATNGDYAVVVSNGLCTDTSACFSVTTVGIDENGFNHKLVLSPNPTNGEFSIDLGEELKAIKITIRDIMGKQILSRNYGNAERINLKLTRPAGVYFVMIEAEDGCKTIRLVKK